MQCVATDKEKELQLTLLEKLIKFKHGLSTCYISSTNLDFDNCVIETKSLFLEDIY